MPQMSDLILSITGIITRNKNIILHKTKPAENFVVSAGIVLLPYMVVAFPVLLIFGCELVSERRVDED